MPGLIALSIFITVTALAYALLTAPRGRVRQRLAAFREMVSIEDEPEAEPSFMERVGRPVIQAALRLTTILLPSSQTDRLRRRLTLAGDPMSLTMLLVVWAAVGLLLPGCYLLLALASAGLGRTQVLILLALAGMGMYLPHVWLKAKTKARQKQILQSLPDGIDLLSASVEAGLGIDAALAQVAEKVRSPLAVELRRVLRDVAMGAARRDALRAFAGRTEVTDVQQFVNAIVQAEQMGVSLGQVIRVQADQMRVRRRQRAEQQAFKAPVKMVFPLVLFIFPAIFVVIMGPAVIQIMSGIGN